MSRSTPFLAVCLLAALPACHAPVSPRGPRIVLDGLGRQVQLPAQPRRIVSLAPGVTESILALGLGERLVGVSDFCTLPDGLGSVARVGGIVNPSLETIRSLRPDLLVGTTSGNDPGLETQARALGVPLFTLHTPDVAAMLASLEMLGEALGERERGHRAAKTLRDRLDRLQSRLAGLDRPRVLMILWSEPLVVPGAGSFLTDAMALAGGSSVTGAAPAAHPTYSLEAAISAAPDVILATPDGADLIRRLRADPAWANVPAVSNGRIHIVGEKTVQPGPRVVDGIEGMARLLHPELPQAEPIPPS